MIALIDADMMTYQIPFALEDYKTKEIKGSRWDVRDAVGRHITQIINDRKASSFKLYLTGEGNFREGLATISPYKGNRQSAKPFYHQYIRDLLVEEWGAIVSEGMEADDSIAIEQAKDKDNNIICSLDKDFDQCAGKHYSWPIKRKGKIVRPASLYEVDELQGIKNLYAQAITGDSVDNILYADGKKVAFLRKGQGFADKLLASCETEEEVKAKVMEFYYSEWDGDGMGITWKDAFYEVMSLLYLKRHEEDYYE